MSNLPRKASHTDHHAGAQEPQKRSYGEAAAYYFKGDGRKFVFMLLRPLLVLLSFLGIVDDASGIGIADDPISAALIFNMAYQIWKRRNIRKYP